MKIKCGECFRNQVAEYTLTDFFRFLKKIIFWSLKISISKEQIYKFIIIDIYMTKVTNMKTENKIRKYLGEMRC